jgi:hypothetical protein
MAAAEAPNTFHNVGDKSMDVDHKMHGSQNMLKTFNTRLRGPEGTLLDFDEGVKDIKDEITTGMNTLAGHVSLNVYLVRC